MTLYCTLLSWKPVTMVALFTGVQACQYLAISYLSKVRCQYCLFRTRQYVKEFADS